LTRAKRRSFIERASISDSKCAPNWASLF